MSVTRRSLLKAGVALAAIPLSGDVFTGGRRSDLFSTGCPELDLQLSGGLRPGSFLAVVGPRGGGKTAFFLRLARANGILDAYPMSTGTSDMLSIMQRHDGKFVGSLMLDSVEPSTDMERAQMERDPAARDAFISRWFERSRDITHESGGLFAISVNHRVDLGADRSWLAIPDYVISVDGPSTTILHST